MPKTPDASPQTIKVFGALLEEPAGWHYGYGLSKRTGLASGTLYPILMRLVDRGLLETRWEEPTIAGRPARHTYRLTSDGAALARERTAAVPAAKAPVTNAAKARPALAQERSGLGWRGPASGLAS